MKNNMVMGIHPILEAIASNKTFDKVFIQNRIQGDSIRQIIYEFKLLGVKVHYVPLEKLDRISNKNHQGIIAFISPISFHKVEQILPTIFETGKVPFFLLLDKITDVRNFGAIARTAECVGVDAIIIGDTMAAPINEDSMKTSAGALHNVKVCKEPNLVSTVEYLKNSGLQIICATEKAEQLVYSFDLNIPLALIMGSEDEGISSEILKLADAKVKLPMIGNTASLNVSVACGAILFEIIRQKNEKAN